MKKHGFFISRIQAVDTNVLGWKGLHDWTIMRKKGKQNIERPFQKSRENYFNRPNFRIFQMNEMYPEGNSNFQIVGDSYTRKQRKPAVILV